MTFIYLKSPGFSGGFYLISKSFNDVYQGQNSHLEAVVSDDIHTILWSDGDKYDNNNSLHNLTKNKNSNVYD
jgi:hypothetical protein